LHETSNIIYAAIITALAICLKAKHNRNRKPYSSLYMTKMETINKKPLVHCLNLYPTLRNQTNITGMVMCSGLLHNTCLLSKSSGTHQVAAYNTKKITVRLVREKGENSRPRGGIDLRTIDAG